MKFHPPTSTRRLDRKGGRLITTLTAVTALLVLLAAPAAVTMAAQEGSGQDEQEVLVSRAYRISHMDANDAAMLAHQICLSRRGDNNSCRYEVDHRGWLTYNTDADTQEAIAAVLARTDVAMATPTLRLTLLMADNTDRPQVRLGKSETAALADIRQLLPYRGYRVVETGQLLAQTRGQIRLGGLPYYTANFGMSNRRTHNTSTVQVEFFELHRTSAVHTDRSDEDQTTRGDTGDVQNPDDTRTELLLKTSFTMQVGETVVVGTSRLDGKDEALIVLLTATR